MPTATRPSARKPVRLQEQVRGFLRSAPTGSSRVNREEGYIEHVRVLGLDSDNGRRYLPETARAAIPLYEGKKIKINHPLRPNETRPVQSVFGWLEGIYQGGDGALYAEKLHFLKAHEMAEAVCEAAERNPTLFSLSHNAEGRGRHDNGTFIVEEITEVRSVDIVDDGATNKSLFESKNMGLTLSQLIASSKIRERLKQQLLEAVALCEDGDAPLGDMPVASADAGDAGGDWKADLVAAIGKLVQSEDPEQHAMGLKIMKLLKPEQAAEEGDDGDGDDRNNDRSEGNVEGKKVKRNPGAAPLTEATALVLCRTAGVEATVEVMEAVKGATLDQALAIIGLAKKHAPAPERDYRSAPRSAGPRVPITEAAAPKDSKGWAERLLK